MKKEWIILILIIFLSLYSGFTFGGAYTSNQFDEKYQAMKIKLDKLYNNQCN